MDLSRYAWLSIVAALVTMALKATGERYSGSVGILSDALESGVNLVAALLALMVLRKARKPADDEHPHGHEKLEFFASGFEGALILVAGVLIIYTAAFRLLNPRELARVDIGLVLASLASVVNFLVSRTLRRAGREHDSAVLRGDAEHLMADVWTSVGVLSGVGLAWLTKEPMLDALCAILAGLWILRAGAKLVWQSGAELLDPALDAEQLAEIVAVLDSYESSGVHYHALRTRRSGARSFISLHLLVPGEWSVKQAHDLSEELEAKLRALVPRTTVLTHTEPIEDPVSYADRHLDRVPRQS